MSRDLERPADTDLAPVNDDPGRALGEFDVLDVYAAGVATEEPRVEAIATISAGYTNEKGLPQRSTDGTIYLHDPEGRAPGLAGALARTDRKSLTIAFPFDDPRQFIQQRFVKYSKTRLLAYGDQFGVTVINDKGQRTEFSRDEHPTEYAREVAECKTAFSVYFVLIEWHGDQPLIVFPDGMGFYRIRFSGRNSARSFMGQMKLLTRFTNGRLAGIPFDLRITNREVSDPTGAKRKIPVFVPTMKAPGMRLNSANFRGVLQSSLHQAERLQLMPPTPETVEDAEREVAPVDLDESIDVQAVPTPESTVTEDDGRVIDVTTGEILEDPSEHDLAQLQSPLDYDTERARFFAIVQGSPLDNDEEREQLVRDYWHDDDADWDTSSLREIIPRAEPDQWDAFLAHVASRVETERLLAENSEPQAYGEGVTDGHVRWLEAQLDRFVRAGLDYRTERLALLWFLLGHRVDSNEDLSSDTFEKLRDALGTTRGNRFTPLSDAKVRAALSEFREWLTSDDAAAQRLL